MAGRRSELTTSLLALALVVWVVDFVLLLAYRHALFDALHVLPELFLLVLATTLGAFTGRRKLVIAILGIAALSVAMLARLGWPVSARILVLFALLACCVVALSLLSDRALVRVLPWLLLLHHVGMTARTREDLRNLDMSVAVAVVVAAVLSWLMPRGFDDLVSHGSLTRVVCAIGSAAGLIVIIYLPDHLYVRRWEDRSRPAGASRKPNIVLIVIDTLRADRLGRKTSPFLQSLGEASTVVRHSYASSSWTLPSVATLFTGESPSVHNVTRMDRRIPPRMHTLAEELRANGYATVGVSANPILEHVNGFSRGFDLYVTMWRLVRDVRPSLFGDIVAVLTQDYDRYGALIRGWHWKPRAHEVSTVALKALDASPRDRPRFLFVQFVDPHLPYDAHGDGNDDSSRSAAYDAEVRAIDHELEKFVGALDRRVGRDNTLLIITADHGEQLGEGGLTGHGKNLSEATILVPLIIRFPNVQYPGSADSRQLHDIIAATAGLRPARKFEGVIRASLVVPADSNRFMRSAQNTAVKVVQIWQISPAQLLSETIHRLPDEQLMATLDAQTLESLRAHMEPLPQPSGLEMTDEERARFRALGYVR